MRYAKAPVYNDVLCVSPFEIRGWVDIWPEKWSPLRLGIELRSSHGSFVSLSSRLRVHVGAREAIDHHALLLVEPTLQAVKLQTMLYDVFRSEVSIENSYGPT